MWQGGGRTDPGRSQLRISTRGKSWQYHALSLGYLFCGLDTNTWIRNKRRMRKTTTIMTLIHHVETRSARERRARRTRSFSASSVFALRRSIPSSALWLAGSAMGRRFRPPESVCRHCGGEPDHGHSCRRGGLHPAIKPTLPGRWGETAPRRGSACLWRSERAPTARASTRFHSESQVTMTDQPPERTDFKGSMNFRHTHVVIRREA